MTYNNDARCDGPGSLEEDAPGLLSRSTVSPLLPTVVEPWRFCVPDRPAPVEMVDLAWLVFLGVEPQEETPVDPWMDFLRS